MSNVRALDFGARGDVFKSLWIFLSSKWHRMNPVQRVFIHVKIKYKILTNGEFLDLVVVDVQ